MTGGTVTASSGQHFGYSGDATPGQEVTLNMSGGVWTSTSDSIHFGSRASYTANINLSGFAEMKMTASDTSKHIIIGGTSESGTGKANVTMKGNALLSSSNQIFIGNNDGGVATVTMSGDSRMEAKKIVISRFNGTGTVTLSDEAQMSSSGDVIVGENGSASLTLNGGSSVQSGSGSTITIGGGWNTSASKNAATGTVTLNGNSSLSTTGIYLGKKNNTSLANEGHLVLNGGTVTTRFIRKGDGGNGSGEGSSITFNGGKIVFESGQDFETALFKGFTAADLKIQSGGLALQIDANASLAQGLTGGGTLTKSGAGVLTLGVSGAFTGDVIVEEGGLILQDGAIDESALLSLASGTTLDFDGDFTLVVSSLKLGDTVVGEGVYTATDLENLEWNITFGNDVTIQVIPEPSTYALAFGGLGVAAMALRRRKRKSDVA